MAKRQKFRRQRFDLDYVKQCARGRWPEILARLGGIDPDILDEKQHHPCPKCGGTDRFRFTNLGSDGSVLCNQCGRTGDGLGTLVWMTGKVFAAVLAEVAAHLGIEPETAQSSPASPAGEAKNPAEHLIWLPWSEIQVAIWCLSKPPITPAAVLAVGGKLARYRNQFTVIALPVWSEKLDLDGAEPVGWCLYNVTGGPLPGRDGDVKVKLTAGSKPGLIGDMNRLRNASEIWKTEGPSDMLALLSLADLPHDHAVITNANGCGERPPGWWATIIAGRRTRVIHDADLPGQKGATGYTDDRGRWHHGWCEALGAANVVLPYPTADTHGQDLRDFLTSGATFGDLLALCQVAPAGHAPASKSSPVEAEDDYHRLARANIENYRQTSGAVIRYWREEFYTWKPSRGCYRKIGERDFRAKLTAAIKAEFDRLNIIAQREATGDEIPETKRVSTNLVTNVLNATSSLTNVPASVEMMTWLGVDGTKQQRSLVAMANGLIDVDKLLQDADESECILPHTPEWFSTVRLPYAFDAAAKCPRWDAFLERNLELDPERIKLLQEWAGYLLLPDTGQQKFLVLEGEGANGKSVYCAAIAAMLGRENCAHVPLEIFADRFAKTSTLGKLVNICADVGELDKMAEGYLKSFTSGDVMEFGRKFLESVNCAPTARLMLACNNRPRFSDRSSGVWRRMLLVPWRVQIGSEERIANMDKPWWWEQSGELPGIFKWALIGLDRLRQQGRFTESELCKEAIEDYRQEANPARQFLMEHTELGSGGTKCHEIYELYAWWSEKTGHRPLGERQFGKEVKRTYPETERKRGGLKSDRYWWYANVRFTVDDIFGKKTHDAELF